MNAFLILFGLALAVIQIIMIIKFFEIASNIKSIKDLIFKHLSSNAVQKDTGGLAIDAKELVENERQNVASNNNQLGKDDLSGWTWGVILIVIGVIVLMLFALYIFQ